MVDGAELAEEALDQLLEITVLLAADLARGLAAMGLTQAQAHLLHALSVGGPRTQRALAEALGVTPRTITTYVDDLAAAGLVTREPHPTDRRAALVTPTAEGWELVDSLATGRAELAEGLFADLTVGQLRTVTAGLDEALGRLREMLAEQAAGEAR